MILTNLKSLIKIVAPLDSVPFKRVAGNLRKYNDPRYRAFKDALGYYALAAMQGRNPFSGAVKLSVDVYKPKPQSIISRNWGDLDNHVKSVMDALTGICYDDDRQITEIHARKFFGLPNIIIALEESKCSE